MREFWSCCSISKARVDYYYQEFRTMIKRFRYLYCGILVISIVGLYCWTAEAAQSFAQKVVERCECQNCENRWFAKWRSTVHPNTTEEETLAVALALLPFGHIHPLCGLVLDYYDAHSWLTMSTITDPGYGQNPIWVHYYFREFDYPDAAIPELVIPNGKHDSRLSLIHDNVLFKTEDISDLDAFLSYSRDQPHYSDAKTTSYKTTSLCKRYKVTAELKPGDPVTLTRQCRLYSNTRIIALIKQQIIRTQPCNLFNFLSLKNWLR